MADSKARQVDTDLIRDLATLLDDTGLTEIEIGSGDSRIRIARTVTAAPAASVVAAAAPAAPAPAQGEAEASGAPEFDHTHPGAVTSPMVGTAYMAPEPGAAPFVSEGARVEEGQTLMIVEAMKVMNHIRAPRGGTVRKVLVENGQPVEFGELLMIIE